MQDREEYDDEINLLDYINVLKRQKKLIIIIVAISVLATGIISFLLPKIYEAKAVIMPISQPHEQGGISSLASQFGISTSQGSTSSEIVSLFKSNILMERAIKKYNLTPVFFGKNNKKGISDTNNIWPSIRYLKKIFRVKNNVRDGIIELSLEFKDPKTAANILKYMLTELTDYMSSEARRVAETNRNYLESLIDKNADPLIRQNIYSLIARQIETSMMAEVKENFAFKILDPPKVPDRKIKPSIRGNVMLAFSISLVAGIFIAFFIEYWENVKMREKTKAIKAGKDGRRERT